MERLAAEMRYKSFRNDLYRLFELVSSLEKEQEHTEAISNGRNLAIK
jgi:hypothetical protein